jgi:hypothetical protein
MPVQKIACSWACCNKKDGIFYLKDEDGDLREIFISEEFVAFIDDLYWELYEEENKFRYFLKCI